MSAPTWRIKVACINWSSPDAPHAMAYVMRDGEMVADFYFPTWAEAMAAARRAITRCAR